MGGQLTIWVLVPVAAIVVGMVFSRTEARYVALVCLVIVVGLNSFWLSRRRPDVGDLVGDSRSAYIDGYRWAQGEVAVQARPLDVLATAAFVLAAVGSGKRSRNPP
jgi:hypothetical protein